MTKRQNQIDSIIIEKEGRKHLVTLERLKNDTYGNPRYKAVICFLEENATSLYNAIYTFKGHYMSIKDEALWIVEYYYKNK